MEQEQRGEPRDPSEPETPIPLPEDLAAFLRTQGPYACLTHATDQGTAYVIKAPAADIAAVRGTVPVKVTHMLIEHRAAPVIRTLLAVSDQPVGSQAPQRPLLLESFTNVADEQQRADFAALAEQEQLILLFYDQALQHRLSKLVTNTQGAETIREIVERAQGLRARIPPWRYDFDTARQDIIRRWPL